jgi:hypothetical protein
MSEQDHDHIGDAHGGHRYDPNQPRVPAGQATGGRWTATGSNNPGAGPARKFVRDTTGEESWNFFFNTFRPDGSLAEQVVFNRDRSRIVSEFSGPGGAEDWDERHIVILPDGSKFTFENSGDTQTVYDGDGQPISAAVWTSSGPEALPSAQPAFYPLAAAPVVGLGMGLGSGELTVGSIIAGLALYTWFSSRNGPDGTAVFAFKAAQYRKTEDEQGKIEAAWVGRLTREQVNDVCEKLQNVQKLTDDAVEKVREEGEYDGPADFGTKVHKRIEDGIKAQKDPNYRAEVSLIKTKLEAEANYGERGSVRIDALENRAEIKTVCVYDPKTGWRGLSLPRMNELAGTVQKVFPGTEHIIVTEVRPGQK